MLENNHLINGLYSLFQYIAARICQPDREVAYIIQRLLKYILGIYSASLVMGLVHRLDISAICTPTFHLDIQYLAWFRNHQCLFGPPPSVYMVSFNHLSMTPLVLRKFYSASCGSSQHHCPCEWGRRGRHQH